jgi:hypothetical protein
MEIYRGLLYPHLREAHDRIYFGAWRGPSPTLTDLSEAHQQLGRFLDGLEQELHGTGPPGAREYLAKAREVHRLADPKGPDGAAVLMAINNALSYGHRVLDRLLRAQGEANHVSRAFARWYEAPGMNGKG